MKFGKKLIWMAAVVCSVVLSAGMASARPLSVPGGGPRGGGPRGGGFHAAPPRGGGHGGFHGGPRGGAPAPRFHHAPAPRPFGGFHHRPHLPPPPPRHHSFWGYRGFYPYYSYPYTYSYGGYWKDVDQQVWVEGQWVDTVNAYGQTVRTWQPGHWEIVRNRVWVN